MFLVIKREVFYKILKSLYIYECLEDLLQNFFKEFQYYERIEIKFKDYVWDIIFLGRKLYFVVELIKSDSSYEGERSWR